MQLIGEVLREKLDELRRLAKERAITEPKTHSEAEPQTYECGICMDKGIILNLEKNEAYQCKCTENKRIKRLMKSSNIDEEFVYKRFDTFSLEDVDHRVVEAYKIAKEYSDVLAAKLKRGESLRGIPWLGLLGASGSGKTHLVTAIAQPLIEHGVYPLFFNWVSTYTEWYSYYQRQDQAYMVEEIRKKIYNTGLLIIDDVCKESQKENWIKEFYGIVDYRYRKGLPIIYTSEYYYELIGYLSEATAGRLFERTLNPKTGKRYLAKMILADSEDPLLLNYRLRGLQ